MKCATSSGCASLLRPCSRQSEGKALAKPNYRQQKRQKELSRKSRQAEKLQRRTGKSEPAEGSPEATVTVATDIQGGPRQEST